MTARPDLAPKAAEIRDWCVRHKDADADAWRVIAELLETGAVQTAMSWEDAIAAANRAMERRRETALAEQDGTAKRARLEQRFADAWAIRRALEHSAWRAGQCLDPIETEERNAA
jgi:hypothetical protein